MAATDPYATGETQRRVGFVLGGGGDLGANEVGMLRALLERSIVPDLVVGTSVGALNGAAVAALPTLEMVERLETAWRQLGDERIFDSPLRVAGNLIRERTHLHSNQPLRRLILRLLPVSTFEELAVPFQCVAASIERAAEHWFTRGSLVEPILASSAVPGLLPAVEIGGGHFLDGGIVENNPIGRAPPPRATQLFGPHPGPLQAPLPPPPHPFPGGAPAVAIARP